MRGVARLSLFYIFSFLFLLIAGSSVSVMGSWLAAARTLDSGSIPILASVFDALTAHVHPAAYGGALLVLPSGARRGLGSFATGMVVLVLVGTSLFGFTYGARTLADAARNSSAALPAKNLASDGLLVDIGASKIAFAGPSADAATGSAVEMPADGKLHIISRKDAAERIRKSGRAALFAPEEDRSPIVAALARDFKENSARLAESLQSGWQALLAYSFALALLLSSFSPLSGLTRWPVADLAVCALAFRGVLILERLASSGPVLRFFAGSGFGIPEAFVASGLLGACGLTLAAGGSLFRLAKRGSEPHE
jgi:hypothetical protein